MPLALGPRLWTAVIAAAALVTMPAAAHAHEPPGAETTPARTDVRRLFHLTIEGDLDSAALASDINRAVGSARQDGADMILLDVSGTNWRADVLLAIGQSLTVEPRLPLLVMLSTRSGTEIGAGQAWLCLLADAAYIDRGAVVQISGMQELSTLSPPGMNRERTVDDLRTLAWPRLTARAAPTLLTAVVPAPAAPMWTAPSGEGGSDGWLHLLTSAPEPSEAGAVPLLTADPTTPGAWRGMISADTARRIGLVSGHARAPGEVFAERHLRVLRTDARRVVSRLPDARRRLAGDLPALDAALAGADGVMDSAERQARSAGGGQISAARTAASRQLLALDPLERRLSTLEALTAEFPELLRASPPGKTPVSLSPARLSAAWRDCFQDRRDQIARLRARAQAVLAAPDRSAPPR